MTKREDCIMSKNWWESRSDALTRNEEEWSCQSIAGAALGLLQECFEGGWRRGCSREHQSFGRGFASHQLGPAQFGALVFAKAQWR